MSENKNLKKECFVRNKSVYVGHRFIFIINVFMNGLDYNVCFCSKIQSRKFCVFGINLFSIYKHQFVMQLYCHIRYGVNAVCHRFQS